MAPATIPKLVCWMLVLLVSLAVCVYSIFEKWHKFETSPVIISFAETSIPVWQIPFPAVTVCSYTASRATVFNYTRVMGAYMKDKTVAENDKEFFEAVSLLCVQRNPPGKGFIGKSALDIIKEVGPEMSEVLSFVRWRNQDFLSGALFHPLLTHHGVCYTFNMLNTMEVYTNETQQNEYFLTNTSQPSTDWSLEDGYTKGAGVDSHPARGFNGLIIGMDARDEDLDYMCQGPHQGFKVFVHNPTEVPGKNTKFVHVPLNQEVNIAVTPSLITTSEELKDYPPERRQCHYPSSRRLHFFNVYTKANCELECITNYTLYMCDCVAFYMPHNASTRICGPKNAPCVKYVEGEIRRKKIGEEIMGELAYMRNESDTQVPASAIDTFVYRDCDCLPTCIDLQYETKVTLSDFPWQQVLHGFGELPENASGMNKARANVFFEDSYIVPRRRSERYRFIDYIGGYGCLLGIFIGFVILSIVEIICYFSARTCCKETHRIHDGLAPLAETDDTELEETKLHIP